MESKIIKIATFDLKSKIDYRSFLDIKERFLNIMSVCYGNRYFGDDVYKKKLSKKEFIILIAYKHEENKQILDSNILGTLFYKHTGKMSGFAILKEYRGLGISSDLIECAKKNLNYLFGEVSTTNHKMQLFLSRRNFHPVKDIKTIHKNLYQEKDRISVETQNEEYIAYYHSRYKYKSDKYKKFIMYEWHKK